VNGLAPACRIEEDKVNILLLFYAGQDTSSRIGGGTWNVHSHPF
jgi:hypothetical protein